MIQHQSWAALEGLMYIHISELTTSRGDTTATKADSASAHIGEMSTQRLPPPSHHIRLLIPPEEKQGTIIAKSMHVEVTMDAHHHASTAG